MLPCRQIQKTPTSFQMDPPVDLHSDELTKLLKKSTVHICQTFELLAKKQKQSVKETIDEMFDAGNAPLMHSFSEFIRIYFSVRTTNYFSYRTSQ